MPVEYIIEIEFAKQLSNDSKTRSLVLSFSPVSPSLLLNDDIPLMTLHAIKADWTTAQSHRLTPLSGPLVDGGKDQSIYYILNKQK